MSIEYNLAIERKPNHYNLSLFLMAIKEIMLARMDLVQPVGLYFDSNSMLNQSISKF